MADKKTIAKITDIYPSPYLTWHASRRRTTLPQHTTEKPLAVGVNLDKRRWRWGRHLPRAVQRGCYRHRWKITSEEAPTCDPIAARREGRSASAVPTRPALSLLVVLIWFALAVLIWFAVRSRSSLRDGRATLWPGVRPRSMRTTRTMWPVVRSRSTRTTRTMRSAVRSRSSVS